MSKCLKFKQLAAIAQWIRLTSVESALDRFPLVTLSCFPPFFNFSQFQNLVQKNALTGLFQYFSVEEHLKNPLWKPDSMSVASYHTHFFGFEKKPTFKPKLISAIANCRVFGPLSRVYKLYLPLIFKKLLMWVSLYQQTKIGRYAHTFCKTISVNQVCATTMGAHVV